MSNPAFGAPPTNVDVVVQGVVSGLCQSGNTGSGSGMSINCPGAPDYYLATLAVPGYQGVGMIFERPWLDSSSTITVNLSPSGATTDVVAQYAILAPDPPSDALQQRLTALLGPVAAELLELVEAGVYLGLKGATLGLHAAPAVPRMQSITSNYTLVVPDDNAVAFDNFGATGAVTFTLPAVATSAGMTCTFRVVADQPVTVTAPAGALVGPNTASGTSWTTAGAGKQLGALLHMFCNGAQWVLDQDPMTALATLPLLSVNAPALAAGSTQGTAAALSVGTTKVTGADGTKGVVLPTGSVGLRCEVINANLSSALKVYPDSGGTVQGGSTNASVNLAAGKAAIYVCVTTPSDWWSLSN